MRPSRRFLVVRPPKHRDFQIWEDVVVKLRTQTDVAQEYGLSQPRIAQIVDKVADWIKVSGVFRAGDEPAAPGYYAWVCYAEKLEAYERRARAAFEESCAPQQTVKVVAPGEDAAATRVETTTRPGKPHARLLTDAREAAYDLCLAQVEIAERAHATHKEYLEKIPLYGLDQLVDGVTVLCRAIDRWETDSQTHTVGHNQPPKWSQEAIAAHVRHAWRQNPKTDFSRALPPPYAELYRAWMPLPARDQRADEAAREAAPPPPAPRTTHGDDSVAAAPDWEAETPWQEDVSESAGTTQAIESDCATNCGAELLIVPEEQGLTSVADREEIPPETGPRVTIRRKTPPPETGPRVIIRRKTPPPPRPGNIRINEMPGAAYPLGYCARVY